MTDRNSRVQQLIIRYFNQLRLGCSNANCQNPNCASSSSFAHPNLSANQAAILAMQLTADGALLCYPPDGHTGIADSTANAEDCIMVTVSDEDGGLQPSDAGPTVETSVPTTVACLSEPSSVLTTAVAGADSLSAAISAAEESSPNSLITPREVTRLLMFLLGASENDEDAPSRSEETSANDVQTGHNSRYVGSSTRGSLREASSLGIGAGRLSLFNSSSGSVDSTSTSTAETLKNLLSGSTANSTIPSLISSSNLVPEKEARTEGLTLGELEESIAIGRKQGEWSHLIGLLSAIFTSYEALSSSFPAKGDSTEEDRATWEIKQCPHSSSGLTVYPPFHLTHATGDEASGLREENTEVLEGTPMDEDGALSKPVETIGLKSRASPATSDVDDLPTLSILIKRKDSSNFVRPVSVPDVRSAWSMIFQLPDRQTVVDALMRAVRRLVVQSLYQLLVAQPPEGLADSNGSSDSTSLNNAVDTTVTAPTSTTGDVTTTIQSNPIPTTLQETQQRIINLFIILYECPFATDPLHFEHLLLNINRAATWLPESLQAQLCRAWAEGVRLPLANCTVPPAPEQTNLWSLQRILLHHITLRCLTTDCSTPNEDKQICEAALVLRMVYYASLLAGQMDPPELLAQEALENREFESQLQTLRNNHRTRRARVSLPEDPLGKFLCLSPNDCRKPFIPAKDFINETLNEGLKPKQDYVNFRSSDPFSELSFMKLPFLLETSSKSTLLYYDNRIRMLDERRGVMFQSFFVGIPELPFFKLHISRDRIVEDALLGLEIACLENPGDLKKQLLVEFENEQGIDEGGLSKEFFQLIIEKIFDPVYGMFVLDEQCQTYWFNPVPLEDLDREYCLIGILLGLAIYNDIILDVHFPAVLYRKLVGKLGTYEDLKDARPDLAVGLQALLDYEDDDLREAFDCYFVIYYQDPFGNTLSHELKPNGSSIPVTKENRREFVDLYANFLLNESVKKQFNAFRRGFQMVVDESPLTFLFRPEEIEMLVCGSDDYDFKELERVTSYEDYTSDSPVIKNFWIVVHSMTTEQQRQLLQFATGSDRIPVGGMSKMKFTIARQGADAHRLPTAHTCFNILLLPDYPTLEELQHHLLVAITYCKGFGMS